MAPRTAIRRRTSRPPDPDRHAGKALVRWFRREARDLPWRRTDDPYALWVAEVLLQQTRVDQALPYFERFLRAFPTLETLAGASRDRVLKLWEGAGYYGRAHRLHEASQIVLARHGGRLPSTPEALEELPGFGPYTSRSVAAIAYGVPVVALDANALRVLARISLVRETGQKGRARLEAHARAMLGDLPPRAFNEGLMEVGQRFCLPRAPRCPACPLRSECRARRELPDPGSFPVRGRATPRPRVGAAVGVLAENGRVLVGRRPSGGLLPGLWEFPGGKIEEGETPADAVVREFREETGIDAEVERPLGIVEHDYSHFHATLHVFLLSARAGPRSRGERPFRWVGPLELSALALPGATRKMLPWVLPTLAARPRGSAPRPAGGRGRRPVR
jgi:A/G-specific adenine glycosylase